MSTSKSMAIIAFALALSIGLSGCGRKGALQAPADNDPNYARAYPAVEPADPYVDPNRPAPAPTPVPKRKSGNGSVYDYVPAWK